MASDEYDVKADKKVVVPRTLADIQRFKLEKLLKNPDKPVFIPEKSDPKLPRVFNPPEFIRNIWGSSAGAGSGDFHVYRGIRRREYARQKFLNQKSKKDELDEEFLKRLAEHKQAAVDKTAKKRAKRLKKKQKEKEAKKKKMQKKSSTNNDKKYDDSDTNSEDASDTASDRDDSGDNCSRIRRVETESDQQTDRDNSNSTAGDENGRDCATDNHSKTTVNEDSGCNSADDDNSTGASEDV